jgi:hypothetical protein
MFRVKVDREEPTDLHEQVAGEIRRAIAEGEAKPGERLTLSSPPLEDRGKQQWGRAGIRPGGCGREQRVF